MTKEEATEELVKLANTLHIIPDTPTGRALKMAMDALEVECYENAISRQAAIEEATYIEVNNGTLTEMEIALMRLPSVTPKQRWIPLAEREPEKEGEYLVTFDDGFVATVTYSETDTNGGMDWELWADSGEPIAWMLLPTPYKAESEGEG